MNEVKTVTGNENVEAYEKLVTQWQDVVYNTALGIVQHAEDAEDITQEVFVQLFQSWESFRGDSLLSTWLYRVTINKALDFEKKKKRQKRGGLLQIFSHVPPGEEPVHFEHPGVVAENKENASHLFAALKKLPTMQRLVFVLHKLEGMTPAEIGHINILSTSAVESLLARARKNLRKELQTWFEQHYNE